MPAAAQKPILLYGPNGKPLRSQGYVGGGNNRLVGPAQWNWDRRNPDPLGDDIHRNITNFGRERLLSWGRKIYFGSHAVRGAVEDVCKYAAGQYHFESRSADEEWKTEAENLIYSHDRFCDVSGPPHNHRSYRKSVLRSLYLDGDIGCLYVRDEETGWPYLQLIPSHRIKSCDDKADGGPYDGARIIDGVIVDGTNKPIAYRVYTSEGVRTPDRKEYEDIPATQLHLHFQPLFPGQVRGLPILGLAAWTIQDINESDLWELLAQKAGAGRVFIEYNEDGEPQPGADFLTGPSAGASTSQTPTGMWREVIDGGVNTYFKGNTGSSLEAVKFDRPSSNQQAFKAQQFREAMAGAGLSLDFNLDLTKIGGASLRVLIDKINLNLEDLRVEVLEPACRAFDFFRLGTFIDIGALRSVADWFNLEYQAGERLTADKAYDSRVNAEQIRIGVKTRSRATMELGESLEDVRSRREKELDDLFTRASRIKAKHATIPIDAILMRLETDSLNPQSTPIEQPEPEPAEEAE